MTREALVQELRKLPAEDLASILRELLEAQAPAQSPADPAWSDAVRQVIVEYRPAWERLAHR